MTARTRRALSIVFCDGVTYAVPEDGPLAHEIRGRAARMPVEWLNVEVPSGTPVIASHTPGTVYAECELYGFRVLMPREELEHAAHERDPCSPPGAARARDRVPSKLDPHLNKRAVEAAAHCAANCATSRRLCNQSSELRSAFTSAAALHAEALALLREQATSLIDYTRALVRAR